MISLVINSVQDVLNYWALDPVLNPNCPCGITTIHAVGGVKHFKQFSHLHLATIKLIVWDIN